MKTFKKYKDNLQCPVCLKKFKSKQAFGPHFRYCDKAHCDFFENYEKMIIRLYLKGWTREELKWNEHLFFSNIIQNKVISEYLREHPEDRQIKPIRRKEVKCSNCGKPKIVPFNKLKSNKDHFCNKECHVEYQKNNSIDPWHALSEEKKDEIREQISIQKKKEWKEDREKYDKVLEKLFSSIGKENNPEWYKNICKANKIIGDNKKGIPASPEAKAKRMKGLKIFPNKPEKKFIQLIEKYNLPYKYNGKNKNKVIINGKIPDFICTNIECNNKIIEIFGEPFHKRDFANWLDIPFKRTYQGTKYYYKKENFECLIIWSKEFDKSNWEKEILNKVNKFEDKCKEKEIIKNMPVLNYNNAGTLQVQLANCSTI